MKIYNVNIDRQKPSSEEILSRRDFDGLMKQYKAAPGKIVKKPFWKSGWFIGSMATAVVVVSAVVLYLNSSDQHLKANKDSTLSQGIIKAQNNSISVVNDTTTSTPSTVLKRKISPPLAGLNIRNHSYKFNSAKGCTFTHTSGTKVSFPANAFVDENGNPVSGNVDIQYREFRDQADFFLSGIPMQYDSAGNVYQFESAGMLEIAGMMNGKPVFLKKDKAVKIEFASKNSGTQYNLYKFDTIAGNWNYFGKDQVMKAKTDSTIVIPNSNAYSFEDHFSGPPIEPVKPLQVDKKKNRFTVAINPLEFPEMKQYKDMIFQVDESRQKFNKDWYSVSWESIKLSYGDAANKYKIALTKGKEIVMLDVFPVLDDKAYSEAKAKYDKEFADYSLKLQDYNAWLDRKKNEVINGNQQTPEQKKNSELNAFAYRTFEVSGFGIYNMDCPASYPQGGAITLTFKNKKGEDENGFSTMFLADRNKIALYSFYSFEDKTTFRFNPRSSNVLWAVKDGALFYADNDQISKLPTSGSSSVRMDKVEKDFKSPEEMKKFFHIGQVRQ